MRESGLVARDNYNAVMVLAAFAILITLALAVMTLRKGMKGRVPSTQRHSPFHRPPQGYKFAWPSSGFSVCSFSKIPVLTYLRYLRLLRVKTLRFRAAFPLATFGPMGLLLSPRRVRPLLMVTA